MIWVRIHWNTVELVIALLKRIDTEIPDEEAEKITNCSIAIGFTLTS